MVVRVPASSGMKWIIRVLVNPNQAILIKPPSDWFAPIKESQQFSKRGYLGTIKFHKQEGLRWFKCFLDLWMIKLFGSSKLEGRLREPPHPQDPSASAFHATVGQGSGVWDAGEVARWRWAKPLNRDGSSQSDPSSFGHLTLGFCL